MKIILVLAMWPSTWLSGHEVHIPFTTWQECREAIDTFKPDERAFLIYCTHQDNETWIFKNQKLGDEK